MTPIAYLLTIHPLQISTFIERELDELRRQKRPIDLVVSLKAGDPAIESPTPVIHPSRGAVSLLLFTLLTFVRHPIRLSRLLITAIRLDWKDGLSLKAGRSSIHKTVGLVPLVLDLDQQMPQPIRHIHAHFAGIATTAAMLLASWRRGSFSFTAHGSDLHLYPPANFRQRIEDCVFCITVSEYNRRHILDQVPARHAAKIHVIHCGVNTAWYAPPQPRTASGVPRLLTVARLDPVKGLESFIRAMHLHQRAGGPPCMFSIIGDGPLEASLKNLTRELGLEKRVHFLGFQDSRAIRQALWNHDAFVLPSVSEGFPVVLMEAASARMPLIASRITGIPEILREGRNGLFLEPLNPEQQAQVLLELTKDEGAVLAQLRDGAAGLDLDPYELSACCARIKALFDGLN